MYTLQAKYNKATIMLPEGYYLDETCTSKVYTFLNHPAFSDCEIVIMPDAHDGSGACIGFTKTYNGYVIPNIVGVDISCGMIAQRFKLSDSFDFSLFDRVVRDTVPCGFKRHEDAHKNVSPLLRNRLSESIATAYKIGSDHLVAIMLESVGTLGGGNHFLEIDDMQDGTAMLVVHTGSRNFGKCICEHHQKIAKDLMRDLHVGSAYNGLEYLPAGALADAYIHDMNAAALYADINRACIVSRIFDAANNAGIKMTAIEQPYQVCHNYIDEQGTVRKGAISALEHERVIIPLNMRDGVIFGTGKGNSVWNYSAPHGAGRILSRSSAKKELSMDVYTESMKDVWTSSVNASTLDESPMAYKDKNIIIEAIKDSVDIECIAKPIYNFKASN